MTMLVRRPLSINHKLNTYLLELYLKTHFSCRGDKYSVPYFTKKYEHCLNAVSISVLLLLDLFYSIKYCTNLDQKDLITLSYSYLILLISIGHTQKQILLSVIHVLLSILSRYSIVSNPGKTFCQVMVFYHFQFHYPQ